MLEARDLHVRLGEREVLRGVTATVAPGEIVAVVGENGAGKSTLLRALAGLVAPEKGEVLLDGAPVAGRDRRDLARSVAYLPQDRIAHWPLAARAVVALGRLPHRAPFAAESASDKAAIESAMRALDVVGFAARPVTALSGGERARVLIARALAQDARFLIADEPTTGLDPAHALALTEYFSRFAGEGRGIIMATHDLSMAARVCHSVYVLKSGEVVAKGAGRDVFTPHTMAAAFQVRALVERIDGVPIVAPYATLT